MSGMKLSIFVLAGVVAIHLGFSTSLQAQENIHALADKWTSAYNTHDRTALGALYAENAHLMINGAPTYVGREKIEEFWAADFEDDNPLTLLSVTHSIEGVDMMLVHGNYQVVDRRKGDILGRGRFAHIWTKGPEGEWLLDRDLWAEPFEPFE